MHAHTHTYIHTHSLAHSLSYTHTHTHLRTHSTCAYTRPHTSMRTHKRMAENQHDARPQTEEEMNWIQKYKSLDYRGAILERQRGDWRIYAMGISLITVCIIFALPSNWLFNDDDLVGISIQSTTTQHYTVFYNTTQCNTT